ncbi:MAG: CheR family methyltransferase [Bacteroidota bacterium]
MKPMMSPNESGTNFDTSTNSYSLYFRNPLDFSILEQIILPALFKRNEISGSKAVRIWSAECADGQEPYSLLMVAADLIKERLKNESVMVFATDISAQALQTAKKGSYSNIVMQNVKLSRLTDYFSSKGAVWTVTDKLKQLVEFSYYDLLDTKSSSPPCSIFGGFDLVVCCNVLIYYKPELQLFILDKLYNSLTDHGCLMVDQSEKMILKLHKGFRMFNPVGNIFTKA